MPFCVFGDKFVEGCGGEPAFALVLEYDVWAVCADDDVAAGMVDEVEHGVCGLRNEWVAGAVGFGRIERIDGGHAEWLGRAVKCRGDDLLLVNGALRLSSRSMRQL